MQQFSFKKSREFSSLISSGWTVFCIFYLFIERNTQEIYIQHLTMMEKLVQQILLTNAKPFLGSISGQMVALTDNANTEPMTYHYKNDIPNKVAHFSGNSTLGMKNWMHGWTTVFYSGEISRGLYMFVNTPLLVHESLSIYGAKRSLVFYQVHFLVRSFCWQWNC